MSGRRVLTLARRVMRQLLADRRTVALIVVGPMLVLTLGAILFRSEPGAIGLGVVNEDEGLSLPGLGALNLGAAASEALAAEDAFATTPLGRADVDAWLRDGQLEAAVIFPADFSQQFAASRQATVELRLEGSSPTRSAAITGYVTGAATRALASLARGGLGGNPAAAESAAPPVVVARSYLYAGEAFDIMDFVAPVYIAILAMFFVFLLACVSFLRERSQGTIERLMATPATRLEIVLGYLIGLGFFGLVQVAVILFFTVWVLEIHYVGSLGLMFGTIVLLAVVGVSMGILASAFARTEFQVLQFIPILIIPQVLLGGTFWAVSEMPGYLRPLAYAMPLYYANRALRDVMLKGWGVAEIWPNLAILAGIAAGLIVLSTLMMRREVA